MGKLTQKMNAELFTASLLEHTFKKSSAAACYSIKVMVII